jgi:hypothetical protein
MSSSQPLTHSQRQGAILFLLLLGPAPISLVLFLVGASTLAIAGVLAAIAALVITMLMLYRQQRGVARRQGLPLLPAWQVIALLVLIGAISGATFLLPQSQTASWGFLCVLVAAGVIFAVGLSIRRELKDLDERSALLVLGLMALCIALANAGL